MVSVEFLRPVAASKRPRKADRVERVRLLAALRLAAVGEQRALAVVDVGVTR